jgi:hypothetical protein
MKGELRGVGPHAVHIVRGPTLLDRTAARAPSGQVAAAPPSSVMNPRRFN